MKKFPCFLFLFLITCGVYAEEKKLQFKKKLLFIDSNEACEIADYNKDGILDISAGRNWYPGPHYVPHALREIKEFGKDYQENNGEFAYDVDGDGWLDIIAGQFVPSEVYWYKNPGKEKLKLGKFWKKNLLQKTASKNEIIFFHDFDKDGKPEYIANSWVARSPQLLWKMKSDNKKTSMDKVLIGKRNGHGIGIGDINGDGREDICFQDGWYEQPEKDIYKQPWKLHLDWKHPHAGCPIIITDLNRDGRNDMIVGVGHNYGVYWMEQLPSKDGKTQWKKHMIDKTFSQAHALAWVDLDGDGKKDLITGKRVRGHSGRDPGSKDPAVMYYYTWNEQTLKFTRHLIANGVGTGLFIKTADLNEDGNLDIVVSGKSGTWILFNLGFK